MLEHSGELDKGYKRIARELAEEASRKYPTPQFPRPGEHEYRTVSIDSFISELRSEKPFNASYSARDIRGGCVVIFEGADAEWVASIFSGVFGGRVKGKKEKYEVELPYPKDKAFATRLHK